MLKTVTVSHILRISIKYIIVNNSLLRFWTFLAGVNDVNATASPSTSANYIDRTNSATATRSTIAMTTQPNTATSLVSATNAAHTHLPKSSVPGRMVFVIAAIFSFISGRIRKHMKRHWTELWQCRSLFIYLYVQKYSPLQIYRAKLPSVRKLVKLRGKYFPVNLCTVPINEQCGRALLYLFSNAAIGHK